MKRMQILTHAPLTSSLLKMSLNSNLNLMYCHSLVLENESVEAAALSTLLFVQIFTPANGASAFTQILMLTLDL